MGVLDQRIDAEYRSDRDVMDSEVIEIFIERPLCHEIGNVDVEGLHIGQSRSVGAEALIFNELRHPDGLHDPLRHALRRTRHNHPLAVLAGERIARCSSLCAIAHALWQPSGVLVDRCVGSQDRDHRLEQRKIDHLSLAASGFHFAQGDQGRECPGKSSHHVGQS